MRRFHHVGVITDQVQPGEIFVAETGVHVTNPADHPYRVEYLRFEPDSPVTGPVRDQPHMAFAVDDLEAEIAGERVLLGPFRAMEGLRVAFILRDGAVFEFMQFDAPSAFDGPSILTAELDRDEIARGKYDHDVAGHDARSDVLRPLVNECPTPPGVREAGEAAEGRRS